MARRGDSVSITRSRFRERRAIDRFLGNQDRNIITRVLEIEGNEDTANKIEPEALAEFDRREKNRLAPRAHGNEN